MIFAQHTRQTAQHLIRRVHRNEMKIAQLLLPLLSSTANAFAPIKPTAISTRAFTSSSLAAMPICIVVEAEIKEDRMEEFLDMIEKNAVGSRAEPGCIRFGEWGYHDFVFCLIPHFTVGTHHSCVPHMLYITPNTTLHLI
jgi:hypothetical protein